MKILLFSRNDLVNLYGALSIELNLQYEFVHLAYSIKEEIILKEKYGISNVINFQNEIETISKTEVLDINLIRKIDAEIIKYTNGKFCLNSSIQSDRTFAYLAYDEILILVQVYYKFWHELFEKEKIKVMLHEAVALFFLHIASVVSKKFDAHYFTQMGVFGLNKYNWLFVSADNGEAIEIPYHLKQNVISDVDKQNVDSFIANFRKDYGLIYPELATSVKSVSSFSFIRNSVKLIFKALYIKVFRAKKQINFLPVNHVEHYAEIHKPTLLDQLKINYDNAFRLVYDNFDSSKDYYYYPMHMEPEAVVLYWGEGLYKNQIKLIENIAAQLPPNNFLYVKVHPIVKEHRHIIDYLRIQAIPNIKLIGPEVQGKQIISSAKGVMTINGTSGFEGVLLNKPVFVFGNSFYDLSDRVIKVNHIKELREKLYATEMKSFEDDDNLLSFVNAYLKSTKSGFVAYYVNYFDRMGLIHSENVKIVSRGFMDYIKILKANEKL